MACLLRSCVGFAALALAALPAGCAKKAEAPPPPGVTKEMQSTAPPVVDMGGGPPPVGPSQPAKNP